MSTHADTSQPTGASIPNTSPDASSPGPDTTLPQAPSRQKQLSDFEKGKIVFAYEQGWSYQRIADYIGWSKATVHAFIKRYIERGTHENEKAPGRPQKISEATENIILDLIEGDRSITKLTLMQIPELNNIHPRTLDRMLRGKGIRKWIARKRPKLLPRHASARLAWALERKDWTLDHWKKFIWSDECSVERSKGGGAKWVWRKEGDDPFAVDVVNPCRYNGPPA